MTAVNPQGVQLASGERVPAGLVVWAAAVRAPDFRRNPAGPGTNRLNPLVVMPTLQTARDPNILTIGDCAAHPPSGQGGTRLRHPQ